MTVFPFCGYWHSCERHKRWTGCEYISITLSRILSTSTFFRDKWARLNWILMRSHGRKKSWYFVSRVNDKSCETSSHVSLVVSIILNWFDIRTLTFWGDCSGVPRIVLFVQVKCKKCRFWLSRWETNHSFAIEQVQRTKIENLHKFMVATKSRRLWKNNHIHHKCKKLPTNRYSAWNHLTRIPAE